MKLYTIRFERQYEIILNTRLEMKANDYYLYYYHYYF